MARSTNIVKQGDNRQRAQAAGLVDILQHLPYSQFVSIISSCAFYIIFQNKHNFDMLSLWLFFAIAISVLWISTAKLDLKNNVSLNSCYIVKHSVLCGLSALFVGLPVLMLFGTTGKTEQIFMSAFIIGSIALGSFFYASVPLLSLIWIGILGIFSVAVLAFSGGTKDHLAIFFIIFFLILMGKSIYTQSSLFRKLYMDRFAMKEQKDTIALLLRDFDDDTGDWLWETDQDGCLTHISDKMSHAFGCKAEELTGQQLPGAIFSTYTELDQMDKNMLLGLEIHLNNPVSFRDYLIRVVVKNKSCWWLLTAMPLFSDGGEHIGWRGVGRDISDQKAYEDEIIWQANYDSLTELPNRYYIRRTMAMYLQTMEEGEVGALALIHLENLRILNTTLGYSLGDSVLQEIGRRLKIFDDDNKIFTARVSGSDFAILLMNAQKNMNRMINRIIESIRRPIILNEEIVDVDTYVGLALCPQDATDTENLFKCVDLALSEAKSANDYSVRHYNAKMAEQSLNQLSTIIDMSRALECDEFKLHYQPVVNNSSAEIQGVEALIRWYHPTKGMIPPNEFIPLAERSGKIIAIGKWVIEQACTDAYRWPLPLNVSVNVAARQFANKDFVQTVRTVLKKTGLLPERLKLEITESAFIDDSADIKEALNELRSLGVSIVLDDFGTGYSSLTYLRNFPLDELKIDQSFVRTIGKDPESVAIIEMIILLADTLSLRTTAEGVETEEQASFLKEHHCQFSQGYLYAKPISNEALVEMQKEIIGRK